MLLNGVNMRYRVFFLSLLLSGFTVTEVQVNDQRVEPIRTEFAELTVTHKTKSIALYCIPKSEKAGETVIWVKDCNNLAFNYLSNEIKKGVLLNVTLNKKPFGMAADFMGKTLMANPSNFAAVGIGQEFELVRNKT
jgi:hypothetical protein